MRCRVRNDRSTNWPNFAGLSNDCITSPLSFTR
jgi:hypothetical protein